MSNTSLKLEIGNYQVCPIPTGKFGLDGGAMFGTVPKMLWEKSNPADEFNRIEMEARALLLKGNDGTNVLIDTGNGGHFIEKYGEKLGNKFVQMYGLKQDGPSLLKSLQKYGLEYKDITHVLLTHLHFDHAGGATRAIDGKIVPTFSNAKYYIQRQNLKNAQQPNIRERASYLSANYTPLIDAKSLIVLDGDVEDIIPGISLYVVNGHTIGQQIVKVHDGKTALLYCADLIALSSQVRSAWVMGYDLDPLLVIKEKQKFLTEATNKNWYLFFEHDPYCDMAQVEMHGDDFKIKERFDLV